MTRQDLSKPVKGEQGPNPRRLVSFPMAGLYFPADGTSEVGKDRPRRLAVVFCGRDKRKEGERGGGGGEREKWFVR